MKNLGASDESCPFAFNIEPDTFKPGDYVSYRVSGSLMEFPFVGTLVEVNETSVSISPNDPTQPGKIMKGTRESRPLVDISEI